MGSSFFLHLKNKRFECHLGASKIQATIVFSTFGKDFTKILASYLFIFDNKIWRLFRWMMKPLENCIYSRIGQCNVVNVKCNFASSVIYFIDVFFNFILSCSSALVDVSMFCPLMFRIISPASYYNWLS